MKVWLETLQRRPIVEVLLDLDKCADAAFIADLAAVEVHEAIDGNILSDLDY